MITYTSFLLVPDYMDSELVYIIVRDHFQRDDNMYRKLGYSKHFNEYFYENCSNSDIISLTYENSMSGLIEVFNDISNHLLQKYELVTNVHMSWNELGRDFRYFPVVDALILADSNVILKNGKNK